MTPPEHQPFSPARLEVMRQIMEEWIPHNQQLGVELLECWAGGGRARVPWAEHLVGNPETGVLHGGVITALVDATCGMAVMSALTAPMSVATLDLRIDYVRPATPRQPVCARADCYRMTSTVAFVRGIAYQADDDDLVASASGSFMLTPRERGVLDTGAES